MRKYRQLSRWNPGGFKHDSQKRTNMNVKICGVISLFELPSLSAWTANRISRDARKTSDQRAAARTAFTLDAVVFSLASANVGVSASSGQQNQTRTQAEPARARAPPQGGPVETCPCAEFHSLELGLLHCTHSHVGGDERFISPHRHG